MTILTRDAKTFVEGVSAYLRAEKASDAVIPKLTAALGKITASARRERSGSVESAVTLTASERHAVGRLLSRMVGRELSVTFRVNRQLVGGLKIVVGDWVVDTSIDSQLRAMEESLIA